MKFNLATMLLAVALLAVGIGWFVDRDSHWREIRELQETHLQELYAKLKIERAETFNEVGRELSLCRTFGLMEKWTESQLVVQFNLLCKSRQELEPLATKQGSSVVNIAGAMLFYLGWEFSDEQQLIELLDSWDQQPGGTSPNADDEEYRDFLEKVVAERNQLEVEWGELYEDGIQKWVPGEERFRGQGFVLPAAP